MPSIYNAIDRESAASTGANVNVTATTSIFDNPPNALSGLIIRASADDPDRRRFELGERFDLEWAGQGGGAIRDAAVVRSDLVSGGGGIVVFEGIDDDGGLAQIVWSPGFVPEESYSDNVTPSMNPEFWTSDQNASCNQETVCFAEDVRIATAMGGLRAGDIWEGDHVETLDDGPQPVAWVGRRTLSGHGANAPVLFAPGAIGNHSPLKLSQQHRVLLRTPLAELMFGAPEVLVPAKALVNGEDICLMPCARITYVHLALEHHQLLFAEGALCESLLPGDMDQVWADLPTRFLTRPYHAVRPVLSYGEAIALFGARPANMAGLVPRELAVTAL